MCRVRESSSGGIVGFSLLLLSWVSLLLSWCRRQVEITIGLRNSSGAEREYSVNTVGSMLVY